MIHRTPVEGDISIDKGPDNVQLRDTALARNIQTDIVQVIFLKLINSGVTVL